MRRLLDLPLGVAACALAAGVLTAGQAARAGGLLPAFFNPADAAPYAPLRLMRHAPPPDDNIDNKITYAYGPITDSESQNITAQNASTWTGGYSWAFVWANRARVAAGHTLDPANPIFPVILDRRGNPYRVEYTTVARADAATKAEVLYLLGAAPVVWQAPLRATGISAVYWNTLNSNPGAYFIHTSQDGESTVVVDKMVIPMAVATKARGVAIDYEVQDDRPSGAATANLTDLGSTIRKYGKKAYLYTNAWDVGVVARNGFAFTQIDNIKANFDYISLLMLDPTLACDVATGYGPSVNFLKGVSGRLNFSQIIVTVDETRCTPADAVALYHQRAIDHFAGYDLYADGAVEGGPLLTGANLIIWHLLHG